MKIIKPTLGIDFGTSTSSMAWFNPDTQRAEIIKNWEEHEWTPSVVYFGETGILVGDPALQMLEDEEECKRVILSPKRHLASNSHLPLPGKKLKAVDAAAEVLRKLKMDAEKLHFHEPVKRAVITYPASFSTLERDMVSKAGTLAGFEEVVLLEEPVAAALAYAREGLNVGQYLLVYDLGGGTFDVALLENEQGVFRINQTPRGISNLGGDDFDRALYNYCEEIATNRLNQQLDSETENKKFLLECRTNKESLSTNERSRIIHYFQGVRFEEMIDRKVFENMIQTDVDRTVRLTQEIISESRQNGKVVDTVVLIGGSSKIPLVMQKLGTALPVEPKEWQHRAVAVALGAAYYAEEKWPPPSPPVQKEEIIRMLCDLIGSPPLADAKLEDAILFILRDFLPQADFFVSPGIPPNKLSNARESCNVPQSERILGLVDCTVFGSATDALLFGLKGIYFHPEFCTSGTGSLIYSNFDSYLFREREDTHISLIPKERFKFNPEMEFSLAGSDMPRNKLLNILKAIRMLIVYPRQGDF